MPAFALRALLHVRTAIVLFPLVAAPLAVAHFDDGTSVSVPYYLTVAPDVAPSALHLATAPQAEQRFSWHIGASQGGPVIAANETLAQGALDFGLPGPDQELDLSGRAEGHLAVALRPDEAVVPAGAGGLDEALYGRAEIDVELTAGANQSVLVHRVLAWGDVNQVIDYSGLYPPATKDDEGRIGLHASQVHFRIAVRAVAVGPMVRVGDESPSSVNVTLRLGNSSALTIQSLGPVRPPSPPPSPSPTTFTFEANGSVSHDESHAQFHSHGPIPKLPAPGFGAAIVVLAAGLAVRRMGLRTESRSRAAEANA